MKVVSKSLMFNSDFEAIISVINELGGRDSYGGASSDISSVLMGPTLKALNNKFILI